MKMMTFFSHFQKFYLDFPVISANYLPKILTTTFFSHFSQFLLFLSVFFLNIFPDALLILGARGRSSLFTHLPLLFRHLPMHFFLKTPSLDAPWLAPPAPPSARHWWW